MVDDVEGGGVGRCEYEVEWNEGCFLEPLNKLAAPFRLLAVEAEGDPCWGWSSADVGGAKRHLNCDVLTQECRKEGNNQQAEGAACEQLLNGAVVLHDLHFRVLYEGEHLLRPHFLKPMGHFQ